MPTDQLFVAGLLVAVLLLVEQPVVGLVIEPADTPYTVLLAVVALLIVLLVVVPVDRLAAAEITPHLVGLVARQKHRNQPEHPVQNIQ